MKGKANTGVKTNIKKQINYLALSITHYIKNIVKS